MEYPEVMHPLREKNNKEHLIDIKRDLEDIMLDIKSIKNDISIIKIKLSERGKPKENIKSGWIW